MNDAKRKGVWIRRVVGVVISVATILLVLGVAFKAFPRDPWVQIDRTSLSGPEIVTSALGPDSKVVLRLDTPRGGLDRLDVRFRNASLAPNATIDIAVHDAANRELLSNTSLLLAEVPEGTASRLFLPRVEFADARTIDIEFSSETSTPVSLIGFACDCIPTARVLKGWPHQASVVPRDLDIATFTHVSTVIDRTRVVADRIDATHPPGFRSSMLLAAAAVMSVAGFALFVAVVSGALRQAEPKEEPLVGAEREERLHAKS